MKTKLILVAVLLTGGVFAAAQIAVPRTPAPADASSFTRRQTLLDCQLLAEVALTAEERAAVALVRADLALNELQQRAAVGAIRKDYRARTETMTALHASDQKALSEQRL